MGEEHYHSVNKLKWEEICKLEKMSLHRNALLLRKLEEFQNINAEMALKTRKLKKEREKLIAESKVTQRMVQPKPIQLSSTFATRTVSSLFKTSTNLNEFWEKFDNLHPVKLDEKSKYIDERKPSISEPYNTLKFSKTEKDSLLTHSPSYPTTSVYLKTKPKLTLRTDENTWQSDGHNINSKYERMKIANENVSHANEKASTLKKCKLREPDKDSRDIEQETKIQKLQHGCLHEENKMLPSQMTVLEEESYVEKALFQAYKSVNVADIEEKQLIANSSGKSEIAESLNQDIIAVNTVGDVNELPDNETKINSIQTVGSLLAEKSASSTILETIDEAEENSVKEIAKTEHPLEEIVTLKESLPRINFVEDHSLAGAVGNSPANNSTLTSQPNEIIATKVDKPNENAQMQLSAFLSLDADNEDDEDDDDSFFEMTKLNNLQPIPNIEKEELKSLEKEKNDETEDLISSMALNTRLNLHESGNVFEDGETTEGQAQINDPTEKTNQLVRKLANQYLGQNANTSEKQLQSAHEEKNVEIEADDDFDFFD